MLTGRTSELTQLAALLAEDSPVVLTGEAGVGKTALLRALGGDRAVFEGGALAMLSWMAYLPLRRALPDLELSGDPVAAAERVEAAVGPGVLVVDDVQWSDPSTLAALELLAGRVGLLTALRSGDPGADAVLDRLRAAGFVEVALDPLPRAEAEQLARSLRPDLSPGALDRLLERTGGNPLLVRELSATGEPSASLRLALAARLRQLDDLAREAFDLLTVAGRPLRVAALDERGVKGLLAAELAERAGDTVAVRHALLAEVAAEQLPDERRRALHARIAQAVDDDGEAARHFHRAGDDVQAHAAALRAAAAATQPAERAAHLGLAARTADGPDADGLRLRAAAALEEAHDWAGLTEVLDGLDPDDVAAQAAGHLLRARGAWSNGDVDGLRRSLEAGLALVGGSGRDVETQLRIEHTRIPLFVDGDLDRAVADGAAALEQARASGVDVPRALYLQGTALVCADRPEGALLLDEAREAARAAGDTSTEFLAALNFIACHEFTGDPAVGRALCAEYIDRARSSGLGEWELTVRVALLGLDYCAGRYEDVFAAADDLLAVISEARGHDIVVEAYCIGLIDVGRADEALRRVEQARIGGADGSASAWLVRAEAALWSGDPAGALERVERMRALPDFDVDIFFGHLVAAWAAFDLDRDPGDPPPLQERPLLGAVRAELSGIAALHRGDPAAAAELFAAAAAEWAGYHRRIEVRCRWAEGEAARRAGASDAVARLERAEALALESGLIPLLHRIHRSLRAAGVRRAAPRTRDAGTTLTGRQRELLGLVAAGLTTTQIMTRLGLSRNTVTTQLASAVTKLGAANRAQAAALVS